jgi:hypothetical protein
LSDDRAISVKERLGDQDIDASLQTLVKSRQSLAFPEYDAADMGSTEYCQSLEDNAHALVLGAVNEWGVEVVSLRLIDLAPSRTINLLTL